MSAVIEVDSSDEDNDVVEVTETTSVVEPNAGPKHCMNPIIAKSQGFVKEFVDLINLCFECESSLGMERILSRNLIPNYKELDNEYVKSEKFKCFLKNMLKKLKKEPHLKFSSLKEVSENFKANKMKKKVNFVTLNTKVSDKFKTYHTKQNEKKKKQNNIINLDENEDPCPQVINLDDEQSDVIDLESCANGNRSNICKNLFFEDNDDKILRNDCDISSLSNSETIEQTTSAEKTNCMVQKENLNHMNNIVDSDENMEQSDDDNIEIDHTVAYKTINDKNTAENSDTDSQEVVEINSKTVNPIPSINNNYKSMLELDSNDLLDIASARNVMEPTEITNLESEIKTLKQTLIRLEETEVCDGIYSPYMIAHKTKLLIIEKYKKICQLRGNTYNPRKCRQFQLQVKEGHPAGPARKLEEWLNTNSEKNGEPSFPNLRDVIKCVWVANQEDNLGWDINRTYQEARMLFSQCGQHLQRRRQQREWRDLLQTVKTSVHQDPADSDPELLARLEANRDLAKAKFDGIIEHYVKLEDDSRKSKKRIKITEVKSLSIPNPESPCWEVPITGLIQITPVAPSENDTQTNIDIKEENLEENKNNTQENNQINISNETSKNNVCELAYNVFNSVMKNNQKSIEIDRKQTEDAISQNHERSAQNCKELHKTDTKIIESNDVSYRNECMNINNSEPNSEQELPEISTIDSVISKNKSEPVISDNHKDNNKLVPDVKDISASASQTIRKKTAPIEQMETKVLSNSETMETEQITQNINNSNESNKVTENTQIKVLTEDTKITNIDKDTLTNDTKIKSEVKMEIDFSEEDFDLMLDKNFSCDTTATVRVFDVEDTVVIIELSSSESESDDDDCQLITL